MAKIQKITLFIILLTIPIMVSSKGGGNCYSNTKATDIYPILIDNPVLYPNCSSAGLSHCNSFGVGGTWSLDQIPSDWERIGFVDTDVNGSNCSGVGSDILWNNNNVQFNSSTSECFVTATAHKKNTTNLDVFFLSECNYSCSASNSRVHWEASFVIPKNADEIYSIQVIIANNDYPC